MKTISFISLILAAGLFFSCGDDKHADESKAQIQAPVEISAEDNFPGPPFDDTCLCDFHEFGDYKISSDNYNIYKRGKGWNPSYYSCSWVWGEDIANISPEDTTITIMKIHLLDLDNFTIPTDSTEFGADSIRNFVIATLTRDRVSGYEKCVFDPYKTGKYPKPPQWTEE